VSPWPSVGIIILNWNGGEDTLACLNSLSRLDYPARRVLLVDNGSGDDSLAQVRARFADVTVIENGRNLGYAGGNNVGLRWALAQKLDYALLLNNDTEVAPDALQRLVAAAEAAPGCGAAGPTIYYWASPERIWSAGGQVDRRKGTTRMLHLNEAEAGQLGQNPQRTDFVTGCALLIKRAALERTGLLDERFFAYYEEAEWCVRAARAGFGTWQVPAAHIWHKIPLDARDSSPRVHYYMTRNRLLFARLIGMGFGARLGIVLGEYARTWLAWAVRPRWRHSKAGHRRAMVKGVWDACRGHWGEAPF
jgi:GT2 family glycosyltransferase